MTKSRRSKREQEVDNEIIAKGKDVIKDFDASQEIVVEPKNRTSQLISIRLPIWMMDQLREVAVKKGDIGYQQIIKMYIADGLVKSQTESSLCKATYHIIVDKDGSFFSIDKRQNRAPILATVGIPGWCVGLSKHRRISHGS